MAANRTLATVLCVCMLATLFLDSTAARYLPTRSNADRLDKLRELLRDLLESELGRAEYQQEMGGASYRPSEGKLFFKREIPATH